MVHFMFIAPMHSYVTNVLVYNLHITIFTRMYSYVTRVYSCVLVCYSYVLVRMSKKREIVCGINWASAYEFSCTKFIEFLR